MFIFIRRRRKQFTTTACTVVFIIAAIVLLSNMLESGTVIHVALAACGNETHRKLELSNIVKSSIIFAAPYKVHFHVFATATMKTALMESTSKWPTTVQSIFEISYYKPYFPSTKWENMYRPCSTLRLFMPLGLPKEVKKVIYIDTDSVLVGPLWKLWEEFTKFDHKARLGMSLESFHTNGWYDEHPEIPVPVKHGLNAGVLLMNVAKIRSDISTWLSSMENIAEEQKNINRLGDQDILNQYLAQYPDQLHIFSCSFNFRPTFCQNLKHVNELGCPDINKFGVFLLHGSNFAMHTNASLYNYFFNAFQAFNFSNFEDLLKHFKTIESKAKSGCACYDLLDRFVRNARIFRKYSPLYI